MSEFKKGDAVQTAHGIGRILRKWDAGTNNWLVLHVPEESIERGFVGWYNELSMTKLVPEKARQPEAASPTPFPSWPNPYTPNTGEREERRYGGLTEEDVRRIVREETNGFIRWVQVR